MCHVVTREIDGWYPCGRQPASVLLTIGAIFIDLQPSPLKSAFPILVLSIACLSASAQIRQGSAGFVVEGRVEAPGSSEGLPGVNLVLSLMSDTTGGFHGLTGGNGEFRFPGLGEGVYRLFLSHVGHGRMRIDSISVDAGRPTAVIPDIDASRFEKGSEAIVVHARKPLVEQKDGNIVFNASESPLGSGASASELLKSVPMVSVDPDGNTTVRGREPRILVDDKPVEMNARQLQDFLESMPGSLIERIEVMVNPPPQYANEPGGVINIVTRKGRAGIGGRVALSAGTRGEGSLNASLAYRRKGLNVQFNASTGFTTLMGEGGSDRENRLADSVNHLLTASSFVNRGTRPNMRLNVEHDVDARNSVGLTVQHNRNDFDNRNGIDYTNLNRFGEAYRRSRRDILNGGDRAASTLNLSYTHRGRRKGEQFRFVGTGTVNGASSLRGFRQSFFDGQMRPTTADSAQEQHEDDAGRSLQLRTTYDRPLRGDRTFLSVTGTRQTTRSHVVMEGFDKDPLTSALTPVPRLSNDFIFRQTVDAARLSIRQRLGEGFWLTAGAGYEHTGVFFDLVKDGKQARNGYGNWLPFANLNRPLGKGGTLSLVYRRTVRRPGIRELNPAVEYSDPYNIRYGNPFLAPSPSHNLDLSYGRNSGRLHYKGGVGYNRVEAIYASVRTLGEGGVTEATWRNIGDRDEFEANAWLNWTPNKSVRLDGNITYTYNRYDEAVVEANRFRNGASLQARLGVNCTPSPAWGFTANLSLDRVANPQGAVRSTLATVMGGHCRLMDRRLTLALNMTDPFFQQRYRSVTEGQRFRTEGYSLTRTRNFRLTVAYAFSSGGAKGGGAATAKRKQKAAGGNAPAKGGKGEAGKGVRKAQGSL